MEDSAFQQVDGVGPLGDLHIMGDEDDAPPLFMLMAQEVHDDVPVWGSKLPVGSSARVVLHPLSTSGQRILFGSADSIIVAPMPFCQPQDQQGQHKPGYKWSDSGCTRKEQIAIRQER